MNNFILVSMACSILVLLQNLSVAAQVNPVIDLNQTVTIKADQRPLGEVFRALSKTCGIVVGLELSKLDADHDDFYFETNLPPTLEEKIETKNAKVTINWEPAFEAKKYPITIDAQQMSLRVVLDTIVRQMRNYRWELDDGVVNIIPTQGRDERSKQLLALHFKDFSLGKTRPPIMMIKYKIMAHPEVTGFLAKNGLRFASVQSGFTKALHREFQGDLQYSNLTVRQLLNRVALAIGGGWIVRERRSPKGNIEYIQLFL